MAVQTLQIPFPQNLPAPLYFRLAAIADGGVYPPHCHPWGNFVYSFQGVLEILRDGKNYLIPPQYGVWLPPGFEHYAMTRKTAENCAFYVSRELCAELPLEPLALLVTPFMRAILNYLREISATAGGEDRQRVLRVLLDQLKIAPPAITYLPTSEDPALQKVLYELEDNPGDTRPTKELARSVNLTERTLTRRCACQLGITLGEWRNRLRVIKSLPLLEAGRTVESIAFDLGYATASSFIAMFRQVTGVTPTKYRGKP